MSINPRVFAEEEEEAGNWWVGNWKEREGAGCKHGSVCFRSLPSEERVDGWVGVGSAESSDPEEHHGEEA